MTDVPVGEVLLSPEESALIEAAKAVRKNAYAPYSKYHVGSALRTRKGTVFAGCNVENASYGAAICAERNAILQMVAAGELEPVACAVVTRGPTPVAPCGLCRQVLVEFASDMPILLVVDGGDSPTGSDRVRRTTLAALLPEAFTPKDLGIGVPPSIE